MVLTIPLFTGWRCPLSTSFKQQYIHCLLLWALQALSAAKLYPSALNIISSGFIQITWDFKLCYFVPLILKIFIQFKTDKIPITSLRIYILSLLKSMFRVFTPFFLNDYQYLILFFLTVKSSVLSPLNVLADFRTSLADILLRSCFTGFFVFRSIARRGSLCLAVRTVSTLRRGSVWLGPQRVSKPGLSLDHFSTTVFNLCALKVTPFLSLMSNKYQLNVYRSS